MPLRDFFSSPLLNNYLLGYVEDVAQHMAPLPFPKFFRSKILYDHGV